MPILKLARRASLALAILAGAYPRVAHAETTEYRVTMETTWSAQTHPFQFPANPHFSTLIGATHSDQVSFWQVGALASQGIQDMAERGLNIALTQEVQAAIGAGTAKSVLAGDIIIASPGSVSLTFQVDDAFPLVTLVSMLAPSPDWFVGVAGLRLRENGAWIPRIVVDLVVHDAGTDGGLSYTSPDLPSMPHVPIAENMSGAFATNNHVGTMTFVRTALLDAPPPPPVNDARLDLLGANPIRDIARFRIQLPEGCPGELAVYGIHGQRVRSLFRGTAGQPSTVIWDGRDDHGTPLPPGTYFVSVRAANASPRAMRVAVIR